MDIFRICPTLGITREAFLALDKKSRNEKKQVPFFVPACFQQSPAKRTYEQATHCNLIFLDMDEELDGKCPAALYLRDPEVLYTALDGFSFAAYTTVSSTPEKPRMRIVVEADLIPLTSYPQAVSTVAALLGLAKVTAESRVAVQPMFLPTQFLDSAEEDHPLIAHITEGRAFRESDIRETNFPEYTEPKTDSPGAAASIDTLEFLRAPIPEVSLSAATEALSTIDPDLPYLEWLECASALRHQFSPHKAEEAFQIFHRWSATGNKFDSEASCRAKWDSLRPSPIGRVPITIRSLILRAVKAGWDDRRVKEVSFSRVSKWIDTCTDDITTLLERGVKQIVSAVNLPAVQEDVLIQQLCKTAKTRFSYTISTTVIRKDILRLRSEMKEAQKTAEKTKEPGWAKGVCYVSAAQDFYRQRTGERYKEGSLNSMYSRWLLPTVAQLKAAGTPINDATLAKPSVLPSDYALNYLKIPTVYDYSYDPSQPGEIFFVNRGRRYVNTYCPTYPELDLQRAPEAGEILQRHLGNLIGEEEYQRTLIDFMSYMVQCPGRKIRWAVLLQSVEGAGKTFLAECMKAVLGSEHVRTIDGAAVKKGWNEWGFGSQLVVLEEVRVAGINRHEIMNALKPLITNDDIAINQRNRDTRTVANVSNYMLFSNHHDALALTPGDRRYFVLKSKLQNKSQVLKLGEGYFDKIFGMIKDMPGALRAFLNQWEITPGFQPDGHAPRTTYLKEVIEDSASGLTSTVRRLLMEADYPLVQWDIVSARTLMDVILLEDGQGHATPQQVGHVLREEGFKQIVEPVSVNRERHYLWIRPGVDEGKVKETAEKRVAGKLKNLGMELVYE